MLYVPIILVDRLCTLIYMENNSSIPQCKYEVGNLISNTVTTRFLLFVSHLDYVVHC